MKGAAMPNPLHAAPDPDVVPVPRFRPRLLPTLAALVTIPLCVTAGNWQQRRMHEKESQRAEFAIAQMAEPVALASLPASSHWTALRYRPVMAVGQYVPSRQIFIDNKVHAGHVGFHVVTPLAL